MIKELCSLKLDLAVLLTTTTFTTGPVRPRNTTTIYNKPLPTRGNIQLIGFRTNS